jgi:hypothetical protein
MANEIKDKVIKQIENKLGSLKRVGKTQSLFFVPVIDVYIYFRFSAIQKKDTNKPYCFYGLRKEDIALMQGKKSFICFLTDDENKIFLVPFNIYEIYFNQTPPSVDGQYKTNIHFKKQGTVLDFANMPKFNADGYLGIEPLFTITQKNIKVPELTHYQLQSLIGSIGSMKGYDIWFPVNDRERIDKTIIDNSKIIYQLPSFRKDVDNIISEIDVIWLDKSKPISLFEVEYSTPIYSGLLRFNDVLLSIAGTNNFNIISDIERESKFGTEINRPTFTQSKLNELVTFMNYENVYQWYHNLTGKYYGN